MNDLTRIILGSLLLLVGLATSALVSLVCCAAIPTVMIFIDMQLGISLLEVAPTDIFHLLLVTASGAVSGCLLLIFGLAVGRLNRVEWNAWPLLSSVWLAWVAMHIVVWMVPLVF